MSDLIDRDEVIEIIESVCSADDTYWKPGTLEKIRNLSTHQTPSNTLGALDCIDRQEAIKALCREECGMDPKGCCVGTCYDVEIIEDVPSVQLELSNNSPKLDKENGECNDCIKHGGDWECDRIHCHKGDVPDTNVGELISRQAAIDAISKKQDGVFDQDAEIDTAVIYVYSECKAIIKHLPSILPEGIRCKDCKHWMMGKTTKNYPNPYICELHSFMHGFERSALPEDYCSWAELRGDSE